MSFHPLSNSFRACSNDPGNLAETTSRIYSGIAILGILVSSYHAYSETTGIFTGCNLTVHISCGSVFQYGYTTIAGVPSWLLGVVWFPLMLILGLVLWNRSKSLMIPILLIGDMFTIYLWYIDLGVIWPAGTCNLSCLREPVRDQLLHDDSGRLQVYILILLSASKIPVNCGIVLYQNHIEV